MASDITTIECVICTEDFNNTTRQPKVLPCGHSFCGSCLKSCITRGMLMCCVCRAPFHRGAKLFYPVNRGMVELLGSDTNKLKCLTCKEEFNLGTNRPKVLYCGHSFCGHCLQRFITQLRPMCGVCRAPFNTVSGSAEKIPFNRGMEDLMEKRTHADSSPM